MFKNKGTSSSFQGGPIPLTRCLRHFRVRNCRVDVYFAPECTHYPAIPVKTTRPLEVYCSAGGGAGKTRQYSYCGQIRQGLGVVRSRFRVGGASRDVLSRYGATCGKKALLEKGHSTPELRGSTRKSARGASRLRPCANSYRTRYWGRYEPAIFGLARMLGVRADCSLNPRYTVARRKYRFSKGKTNRAVSRVLFLVCRVKIDQPHGRIVASPRISDCGVVVVTDMLLTGAITA